MENHLLQLLRDKNLRATKSRVLLISLFVQANTSLSLNEIQRRLSDKMDRVTVYRMLEIFIKKGIIRTVPNTSRSTVYILLEQEATKSTGDMFFLNCINCHRQFTLSLNTHAKFKLPVDFKIDRVEVLIQGRCPQCS